MIFECLKKWQMAEWLMFFMVICLVFIASHFLPVNFCMAEGVLPPETFDDIKDVGQLVKPHNDDGVNMIKRLLTKNLIPSFKYVFAAVAILFFVLSLIMMLTSLGDEERITKYRNGMLWGIVGFALISLSSEVSSVLDPIKNSGEPVNIDGTKTVIQKLIAYIQLSLGVLSVAFMFYAGFRFITAAGEQETIDKAKSHFKWGFLGLFFAMLADPLVNGVFYPASGKPGADEANELAIQMIGVLKFLLSFLGVLALAALLISGFYYITSFGDEERSSKAKQIIIGSAIGLIVIFSSYALVATFVPS